MNKSDYEQKLKELLNKLQIIRKEMLTSDDNELNILRQNEDSLELEYDKLCDDYVKFCV